MRKLGSKPSENWTREATEVTASADFTGHWNKETGSVWVQPGASYMDGGGSGMALAEGVTSESDAYDAFGAAGYTRYDNLGPTPGMPHVWSCGLSVGNKFASTQREAFTIGWSQNGKNAVSETPGGMLLTVGQFNPYGYEFHVQIQDSSGDVLYQSEASTMEEGKQDAQDAIDWYLEHGTFDL